ncbi:MAG TPA: SEC-C domain-containing protein, partial [Gemmatimonadales bacterium]|nr:SEC-C domain-containing protein [Gemmatimonadales bacterium]
MPRPTPPPGRNAPCPCGSGRKYKHCCFAKADPAAAPAWTPQDRQTTLARLVRFAQESGFAEDMRFAHSLFWGGRLDLAPPEVRGSLEEDGQLIAAFLHWAIFDMALEEEGDGPAVVTIADRFIQSRAWALTPPQRLYLDRLRGSCLRLYEITEVRLDEGLVLLDLWGGEEVTVRERMATRQLAQWDLVAFRVVEGASRQLEIEGPPYVYPRRAKAPILADLKRDVARLKRRAGSADPVAVLKHLGMRFHHWWLDWGPLAPIPQLVTHEGDPMTAVRCAFDAVDAARVTKGLAAHPALNAEEGGRYVWTEATGRGEATRLLGTIALTPGRLTLETTSESRAARGRRMLEEALGDAIRFRVEMVEDARQALAAPSSPASPDRVEFPPDV